MEITPPTTPPDSSVKSKTAYWRRPTTWIALLLIVVIAQWFDFRHQMGNLQQEFARRLADSEEQSKQDRTLQKQGLQQLTETQVKVGVLEAKLAETQSQALALEAMYQELSSSRDERLLAEVEQALSIAMQQLQFAGNVDAALLALQSADARLARANQPRFLALRKLLTQDIERLKATSTADVTGLSLKIETLLAGIDRLPLAFEQRPQVSAPSVAVASPTLEDSTSYWRRFVSELWQEFRQLVRIERIEHGDSALLAPNQNIYLREHIKLRLLNARLALLQRDGQIFRSEIQQTRELLDRYFDSSAASVQTTENTLKQLAATDISANLQRLVESLTALRSLKLHTGR